MTDQEYEVLLKENCKMELTPWKSLKEDQLFGPSLHK